MCEHDSSASRDGQKHQRSSISPPSAPWRKSSSSPGDRWRRRMLGTALKRGRRPRCWRCRGKLAALRGDAGENAARAGLCAREASATAPRDADARAWEVHWRRGGEARRPRASDSGRFAASGNFFPPGELSIESRLLGEACAWVWGGDRFGWNAGGAMAVIGHERFRRLGRPWLCSSISHHCGCRDGGVRKPSPDCHSNGKDVIPWP